MSDNIGGQVLGASTAIILPATVGAAYTGINFLYVLSIFFGGLVAINLAAIAIYKVLKTVKK